jgi:hypothetical protein
MYGTIARLHPSAGRQADLEEYGRRVAQVRVPGYVGSWMFKPDKNPYDRPTVFLVAMFDDEATYKANADDPAQHERYLEMRSMLDDDPDWMDGTFEASL